ncbi:hypothetical protein CEXT_406991 [Caerostris extrusa]|uniref:Uncharacterized protein n=1 Tax=Caerostris extrusa TaxID=172846 RepID=A0AAV4XVD7_CAEEX|nr:hypothetical protein CEXT_406991 [Caerostris extrusa]
MMHAVTLQITLQKMKTEEKKTARERSTSGSTQLRKRRFRPMSSRGGRCAPFRLMILRRERRQYTNDLFQRGNVPSRDGKRKEMPTFLHYLCQPVRFS